MIRDLYDDYAVLQNGYWRLEVDLARPRIVSLKADPDGLAHYCQEILEPGFGGETILQTPEGILRSRSSHRHQVFSPDKNMLSIRGIAIGDCVCIDWTFTFSGDVGQTLSIEIEREVLKPTDAVLDVLFGWQCVREFAIWSAPSLRFGHDPTAGEIRTGYSPFEEKSQRRVIGYTDHGAVDSFIVHGSPSYPDLSLKTDRGCYHAEQHYCRHVTLGISSQDFSAGPTQLQPGKGKWTFGLTSLKQGTLAPVTFECGNAKLNEFVPRFFDEFLLSAIACDHEFFGNNPWRHAYCPGAVHFVTRGYLVTDRQSWSDDVQGDMETRWKNHILRTLKEGRVAPSRPAILLDSGVWQDACGNHTGEYGSPALNALFVTSCCHVLMKTGDINFAKAIFPDLHCILDSVAACDIDDDGLLEAPTPGTPGTPSSSYNDNLSEGHKDGYLNAVTHEAFELFHSLSLYCGEHTVAEKYRNLCSGIEKAYNEQLWNDEGDHYFGWVDQGGVPHDSWYTHTNFPAVATGIVPKERLARLMRSFLDHPNHHRIFAAGINLDPIEDGCLGVPNPFGIWLHGGVLLGPAAFELCARATGAGPECAWEMLNDLINQWCDNHLAHTPMLDWCRTPLNLYSNGRLQYTGGNAWTWVDGPVTAAGTEPYLADAGAILWAIYTRIIGLRPTFQGIGFDPCLPKIMEDARVGIRLMGRNLTVQCRGNGNCLQKLHLNGQPITGNDLHWTQIKSGDIIEVFVGHE